MHEKRRREYIHIYLFTYAQNTSGSIFIELIALFAPTEVNWMAEELNGREIFIISPFIIVGFFNHIGVFPI